MNAKSKNRIKILNELAILFFIIFWIGVYSIGKNNFSEDLAYSLMNIGWVIFSGITFILLLLFRKSHKQAIKIMAKKTYSNFFVIGFFSVTKSIAVLTLFLLIGLLVSIFLGYDKELHGFAFKANNFWLFLIGILIASFGLKVIKHIKKKIN